MKVKILKGEKECALDVNPDMTVGELKNMVEISLKVVPSQQKLLLTGKSLLDTKRLSEYGVKDGSKFNLIVIDDSPPGTSKQSTDVLRIEMEKFLKKYYNENDTKKILDEYMKEFYRSTHACSLEDWERLASYYLLEEELKL